ncbi:hypothetical protein F5Y16DRAFT_421533 [Xylariaceae sp. FL0255]|nr:hypothetical protein F5Y16DRAFT_421533 [Xylariaceae sp. FL0255]
MSFTFGGLYADDDINHSVLAPVGPRIDDPKYLAQPARSSQIPVSLKPNSDKEADKVYWHEEFQLGLLSGIRTWEAASLTRCMYFSPTTGYIHVDLPEPYGSEAIMLAYERDGLQVDETKWLPFLRRQRWYDWTEDADPAPNPRSFRAWSRDDLNPTPRPLRHWSVDDPKIGDNIKTSIELANRIIESLIQDRHEGLQTLLWCRIEDWKQIYPQMDPPTGDKNSRVVLIPYRTEREIKRRRKMNASQWDFIPTKTSDEWRARLIKLLKPWILGIAEVMTTKSALGLTLIGGGKTFDGNSWIKSDNILTLLSSERMRLMMDGVLLAGERLSITVAMAVTIVHEMAHAIMRARLHQERNYVGNRFSSGGYGTDEPFVNNTEVAEMGHFFELSVFGGSGDLKPSGRPDVAPLVYTLKKSPGNDPFIPRHSPTTMYHVPLTWITRMLSEPFWTDQISVSKRKSRNNFHRNDIVSVSQNSDGTWLPSQLQPFSIDWQPESTVPFTTWQSYQQRWRIYRWGWFDEGKATWIESPWGQSLLRQQCIDFDLFFINHNEIDCGLAAETLAESVDWSKNWSTYTSNLPRSKTQATGVNWAWHIVGLLMMASVPIRRGTLKRSATKIVTYSIKPSQEALRVGNKLPVDFTRNLSTGEQSIPPSVLLRHPWGYFSDLDPIRVDNPSSTGYLDLIDEILEYIRASGAAIHLAFYHALVEACQKLRDDRLKLCQLYPNGGDAAHWASAWFFRIPLYDPSLAVWDASRLSWQKLQSP